jgi:hypothetical protein
VFAAFALAVGSWSRALAAEEAAIPIVSREARTGVAVTVYNQDLALIKDTRDLSLPQGESAIRFEDVASRIDPKTVAVRSVTAAERLAVVEQNYVFDLISPEKLMEKYVGREVELVEIDETLKTQRTPATLLSTNGGLVYRLGDRIAVGHRARAPPEASDQLYARPTLLWRLANSGSGEHKVRMSYLTGRMSWAADYVAVVNLRTREPT